MASRISGRRLNRRSFLRLAGATGAAVLAGCGKPKTPDPTPTAPNPTAIAMRTVVARGGTLRWAHPYGSLTAEQERSLGISARANQEWLGRVVEAFQRENPGWQVTLEDLPVDQADRRLALDANADIAHDLVFCTPQLLARHRLLGDLLDLAPFVKGLAASEQEDLSWSAAWRAGALEGGQWAIPLGLQAHGLVYNRARVHDAGLAPERDLASLDGLLASARKLTQPDQSRWGLGVYLGRAPAVVEQVYAPLAWHFGGNIYDETSGTAPLAGEAGVQAATWLADLVNTQGVLPGSSYGADVTHESAVATAFVQGQVAQAWGFGSYWLGALQGAGLVSGCVPPAKGCKADGAGVLPLPTTGQAGFVGGRCLAIFARSHEPEMAFRLLEFALRPDNLRLYPDAGLPARRSLWRGAEYSSPFYQAWQAIAAAGRPMPATPYYPELIDTISAALAAILTQKADVRATLQKAAEDWNSKYART